MLLVAVAKGKRGAFFALEQVARALERIPCDSCEAVRAEEACPWEVRACGSEGREGEDREQGCESCGALHRVRVSVGVVQMADRVRKNRRLFALLLSSAELGSSRSCTGCGRRVDVKGRRTLHTHTGTKLRERRRGGQEQKINEIGSSSAGSISNPARLRRPTRRHRTAPSSGLMEPWAGTSHPFHAGSLHTLHPALNLRCARTSAAFRRIATDRARPGLAPRDCCFGG